MRIGVPKEIKTHEYRVSLTPASVRELVHYGHKVFVETNAGLAIDFSDIDYMDAGAQILNSSEEVFASSDMVVKVKEPLEAEYKKLRTGQILFTFLHLAADPAQARGLIDSGSIAIAYETVTDHYGRLPLLAPMSEVAGRMSIQVGAHALKKEAGGRGVLLGGVPGVHPGSVVVIGGGVAGTEAVRMAVGLEAEVTILDKCIHRLRQLDIQFGSRVKTIMSTVDAVERFTAKADLVIGAVLIPGASAPKVMTREHLKEMQRGSVLVDIAIDQGGCFATSRPTTHDNPTYVEEGIVHYCVANMPGAVARTSTLALNNVTLPFILAIANKGYKKALMDDPHLLNGLNIAFGHTTHERVARDLGYDYVPAENVLQRYGG